MFVEKPPPPSRECSPSSDHKERFPIPHLLTMPSTLTLQRNSCLLCSVVLFSLILHHLHSQILPPLPPSSFSSAACTITTLRHRTVKGCTSFSSDRTPPQSFPSNSPFLPAGGEFCPPLTHFDRCRSPDGVTEARKWKCGLDKGCPGGPFTDGGCRCCCVDREECPGDCRVEKKTWWTVEGAFRKAGGEGANGGMTCGQAMGGGQPSKWEDITSPDICFMAAEYFGLPTVIGLSNQPESTWRGEEKICFYDGSFVNMVSPHNFSPGINHDSNEINDNNDINDNNNNATSLCQTSLDFVIGETDWEPDTSDYPTCTTFPPITLDVSETLSLSYPNNEPSSSSPSSGGSLTVYTPLSVHNTVPCTKVTPPPSWRDYLVSHPRYRDWHWEQYSLSCSPTFSFCFTLSNTISTDDDDNDDSGSQKWIDKKPLALFASVLALSIICVVTFYRANTKHDGGAGGANIGGDGGITTPRSPRSRRGVVTVGSARLVPLNPPPPPPGYTSPLSPTDLQHLSGSNEEGGECCICFESVGIENGTKIDKCGHIFHKVCLDQWIYILTATATATSDVSQRQREQSGQNYSLNDAIHTSENIKSNIWITCPICRSRVEA